MNVKGVPPVLILALTPALQHSTASRSGRSNLLLGDSGEAIVRQNSNSTLLHFLPTESRSAQKIRLLDVASTEILNHLARHWTVCVLAMMSSAACSICFIAASTESF
jgi:hypothetical protein